MTCDLPAFDSIWLDALVQIGRLTPYQSKLLESANPGQIRIGPCIAVRRLGEGASGQTLLARPLEGNEMCVVKRLEASGGLSAETLERLEFLVRRAKEIEHPSIVTPFSCARIDSQILLVSRYITGPNLGELLVRRGRFPAAIVWHIGRQLAEGLAALGDRDIVHGDIRTANVRLTATGTAVLVDAGIRPAVDPVLTVHSGLSPDRCDGIAPELIGVGGVPGLATDAYALGCLLWQLLAGRPPFPGGDPLVKLSSHQTCAIDDVREWAPETHEVLAEGILRLTARDARDRPTFLQLLNAWGEPGRKCRTELATFRKRFDKPRHVVARRPGLSAPTRWLLLVAIMFAVSGVVVTLADKGATNVVLVWAAQLSQQVGRETPARPSPGPNHPSDVEEPLRKTPRGEVLSSETPFPQTNGKAAASAFDMPMPAPDRHGVVILESSGPYRACDITTVGELAIVGADGKRPQIVIEDQPVKLCAASLRLKNVRIGVRPEFSTRPPRSKALLRVHSQELVVEDCEFDGGGPRIISVLDAAENNVSPPVVAPPSGPASIAWKLLDAAEQRGGKATIRNTLLAGDGPGLYLAQAVKTVEFNNVLKIGAGPLTQISGVPAAKSVVTLRLVRTTCRASGALVRWMVPPEGPPAGQIVVEANDCVFDVIAPRAALFELAGDNSHSRGAHPEWLRSLRITGEGSLTRPNLEVAAWVSTIDGRVTPLASTALEVEGLFAGEFSFAGESDRSPADSEVHDAQAPRRSSEPPGIQAAALPVE
jgi:serine/threonine protein kinase